tara:strand:+ start:2496 stop:2657 length:162 start_codon:yes stop_codon:yes gene_type:complete
MEDIERNLQEENTIAGERGKIDSGHTTGTRMGQERYSHMAQNSNGHNRLEWRC